MTRRKFSDERLVEIENESRKRGGVKVACDEAHGHSLFSNNCMHSDDPRDLLICQLARALHMERQALRMFATEGESSVERS